MRKLLREPLLHFLLLGAGLFLLHGWMAGSAGGAGRSIVITQGRVEQLAASYARMNQRAPSAKELDAGSSASYVAMSKSAVSIVSANAPSDQPNHAEVIPVGTPMHTLSGAKSAAAMPA